jgi:ceramide glucosyltransferase
VTTEHWIYAAVAFLYLCTLAQSLYSLREGFQFDRYVKDTIAHQADLFNSTGHFKFQPRAAIILPCCGVDEKLHHTVEALDRQNYTDYEIIFTFESATDPAYAAIKDWTKNWTRHHRLITAGPTDHRSQKIHNLLAAVQVISPDREALLFLDSDAVPGSNWLGYLVAPLADPTVGASTGYRWYTASANFPSQVRSAWNAATVTLLSDERHNFCWGGATGILKSTWDRCDIAGAWESALSDDYQLSRAVKTASLRIRFVPQALVPSSDRTTLTAFWEFARRQTIITRICAPDIWRSAFLMLLNFMTGGTAVAILFVAGLFGCTPPTIMWAALAGWISLLLVAMTKAAARQHAIRRILSPPDATAWDLYADLSTVSLSGVMFTALMLSSMTTNRFFWRNIEYQMLSPTQTRVLSRK